MKRLVAISVLGLIAGAAAGCQTPEQSSMQASNVCMAAGLHPGTKAYQRCYATNFANSNNYYYGGWGPGWGPRPYYWGPRCGWGGCW